MCAILHRGYPFGLAYEPYFPLILLPPARPRLLFMVGLLTVVVLAAFALPAIADEDMMSSNEPTIDQQEAVNANIPVSCWQYSDVFEEWKWDCD
jgi:hypothetical protein